MSESTYSKMCCCNFCKCVEDNKHIFENKVLINRIHKCKFVDIFMQAQCVDMYERIKLKQNRIYNKYMEKHEDDIEFKNKRNQSKREAYHKSKSKYSLGNETVYCCICNSYIKDFFLY